MIEFLLESIGAGILSVALGIPAQPYSGRTVLRQPGGDLGDFRSCRLFTVRATHAHHIVLVPERFRTKSEYRLWLSLDPRAIGPRVALTGEDPH